MPRFTTEAGELAFSEAYAAVTKWRLQLLSDLIRKVIPLSNDEAIPKQRLAEKVVQFYGHNRDMLRENDEMLRTHKDRFISRKYILGHWSQIRKTLAESDQVICTGHDQYGRICGVFLSGRKKDIEATFVNWDAIVEGCAENRNYSAKFANKKRYVQLPMLSVRRLLTSGE